MNKKLFQIFVDVEKECFWLQRTKLSARMRQLHRYIRKLEAENKKLNNQKEYIYKKELTQLKNVVTDAIELMDDEPAKEILERALKG